MSPHWTACLRSALWICPLIAFVGLIGGTARGEQAEESQERLVLLVSGRMLTGYVTRNAGGYLIEQKNGRVQVPIDEVKFVVNDLREAYRKQRDSVIEPTPATHLALATWCISYRLLEEAGDELKKCLKADPDNEEARRLLQRLTEMMRSALPAQIVAPTPRKTATGFLLPDAESLGGLSRENAAQFTSRIQPLLVNKCGNAHCHGTAASNHFHITSTRISGHGSRQNAERNLAATLEQIDFEHVSKSQLLEALQGAHGGKGTIFVGQVGTEQIKTIRGWVRAVATEKQTEAKEIENLPQLTKGKAKKHRIVQASSASEKPADPVTEETLLASAKDQESPATKEESPKPRELRADPTDAKALALEHDDPFDPEQFNQRFRRP